MVMNSLGYVGFGARSVEDWADYGTRLLGLHLVDRTSKGLVFRMDDRMQRIAIVEGGPDAAFFGWEVADSQSLQQLAARLEAHGIAVARGTVDLASQRRVSELIVFSDPLGNRLEAFYGAEITADPFVAGRAISGFRTGPLGIGHVVLTVERIDQAIQFYMDVLGFRLSDFTLRPFKAYFFHLNPRHHSLALVETGTNGIHHLMMEVFDLDDVGQGYDLMQAADQPIGATLGRHSNDFMTSFYTWTPSEFMVEYGWGGRSIDPKSWSPQELTCGPSLWGHDRSWLSNEGRERAREMRLQAAAAGIRMPVQLASGNYQLAPGVCSWWDSKRLPLMNPV